MRRTSVNRCYELGEVDVVIVVGNKLHLNKTIKSNYFFFSDLDVIMTVVIVVFVEPTSFVIVILVGWVKTALLIVDVMDTVTVHRALVFVTSVKVKENRKNVARNNIYFF